MTERDLFYMLNVIFGGGLAMILSALLAVPVQKPDGTPEFIPMERFGMGVIGGATILLLPRLYTQAPTPFEPWATTLLWAGALVFFVGRAYRAWRHRWGNSRFNPGWYR